MRGAGGRALSKEMRRSSSRLSRAGGVHGAGSGGCSPPRFLRRGWGLVTTSPLHPPILGAWLHVEPHSQAEVWGPRLRVCPLRGGTCCHAQLRPLSPVQGQVSGPRGLCSGLANSELVNSVPC